jgi:uncharacterized protein
VSGFAVPACANCGHAVWPPRLACPVCGSGEWGEVDASAGTVLDVTDTAGASGERLRLGTVRLILAATVEGPPVIARCEGCEPGDRASLALEDGALRARPQSA